MCRNQCIFYKGTYKCMACTGDRILVNMRCVCPSDNLYDDHFSLNCRPSKFYFF